MCDATCAGALAEALCTRLLALNTLADEQYAAAPTATNRTATMRLAHDFEPLFAQRRRALLAEYGCQLSDGGAARAPPLQRKRVENGKSDSAFFVGGGAGVAVDRPASFSTLLKQLNAQESALLQSLVPSLVRHYQRPRGSLLARYLGWLRYEDAAGGPFEAILMDNVMRPAPAAHLRLRSTPPPSATGLHALLDAHSGWRPFDMKGIRLYAHERRFESIFGHRGLRVSAEVLEHLVGAIEADVDLLRRHRLVDYSYLISIVGAPPAAPERADVACADAAAVRAQSAPPRLVQACFCVNRTIVASPRAASGRSHAPREITLEDWAGISKESDATVDDVGGAGASREESVALGAGRAGRVDDECYAVLLRVAVIDYLREWKLNERAEHLRKTLTRDIFAFERNHAVVPVSQFADTFRGYLTDALLSPLPQRHSLGIGEVSGILMRAAKGVLSSYA